MSSYSVLGSDSQQNTITILSIQVIKHINFIKTKQNNLKVLRLHRYENWSNYTTSCLQTHNNSMIEFLYFI